jgi:hypothetical protein
MSNKFNSNPEFENAVIELNELLCQIKPKSDENKFLNIPVILKLGHSRSGSTLFTQWIASLGIFSYPSNFLSLFYKSPSIGARIYELITNPKLTYNNEFDDLKYDIDFTSVSGKTVGLKSPNEFWKFWLEHFEFPFIPVEEDEFMKTANFETFNREIELLNNEFKKPLVIKAHNLNYYLNLFESNVKNAIYVHMYRDPVQVINSVLKGRVMRWGDINHWFGWKPKEYELLKDKDVLHQVAGQVYFNEKAILERKDNLGTRYLNFSYSDFCKDPEHIYNDIISLVNKFSEDKITTPYNGKSNFDVSDPVSKHERKQIYNAYKYYIDKFGDLKY